MMPQPKAAVTTMAISISVDSMCIRIYTIFLVVLKRDRQNYSEEMNCILLSK